MTELFKPHPIYSDYLIGNNGTVISTKRTYRDRAGKLYFKDQYKIQTQHKCGMKGNKKPHLRVSITKDGTHRSVYVHHLVLETFVSPRKNKNTITNHKDGNPSNNNVLNLEWCDDMHNAIHALRNGLRPDNYQKHAERTKIKIKVYDKLKKEVIGVFDSQSEAANKIGIGVGEISVISRGKRVSSRYFITRI